MSLRTLLVALALLGCSTVQSPPKVTPVVDMTDNLDEAAAQAKQQHRLVLLYFYSTSCGYCEKMLASMTDESLQPLLKSFVIVEVNVDTSEMARRIGVTAVPTLVGLTSEGDPVSTSVGYLDPNQLAEFMSQTVAHSQVKVRRLWPTSKREVVTQAP